jgi:hypothetical protein
VTARRISDAERRARLGRRQLLVADERAPDVASAARRLFGLHATDPASVYLAARARVQRIEPADVESALYDDEVVVRRLAMRRTMFVLPLDLVPIAQAACSDDVAARERVRLAKLLEADGVARPGKGLDWIEGQRGPALAALAARGEATAVQLSRDVPSLGLKLQLSPGKKYAASVSAASRLLVVLDAEGVVVRGRPGGSWISTQYRWRPAPPSLEPRWSPEAARVELARRWLAAFGPATEADLKWWAGWNLGQTRAALAALDLAHVSLDDGQPAVVLAEDVEPVRRPRSWVALLPALDPTAMGWYGRDWYLGPHRDALFDSTGNIGPTIWADGRIVGGWAQRADGSVSTWFLAQPSASVVRAVQREARSVEAWLGERRFVSVFPSPLEKQLKS